MDHERPKTSPLAVSADILETSVEHVDLTQGSLGEGGLARVAGSFA
jgi:hypothetical protein